MAQEGAELEPCMIMDGIQPLRNQEGSSYAGIQQQRQAFELEIRVYNGDDPLDVWDRYIRWTHQTSPQGGKGSNISNILERAVQHLVDENKYYDDARYVHLWIKLAQNSTAPSDIYSYMQAQGIGVKHAALYIACAEEFQKQGNFQKAEAMCQKGLWCGAGPLDKLQQYHRTFQASVPGQPTTALADMGPEENEMEPLRTSMVDLRPRGKKKALAPINRDEASVTGHSCGLSWPSSALASDNQRSSIVIFDEGQAGGLGLLEQKREEPKRAKENEMSQSHLAPGGTIPSSKPSFQPYSEEECNQTPTAVPCTSNLWANSVPSAGNPAHEEMSVDHLQAPRQEEEQGVRVQSMYCKELLLKGATEFTFEELRAERYFKRFCQNLDEKCMHLGKVKEELRLQIEEKQRQLQERDSGASQVTQFWVETQSSGQVAEVRPGSVGTDVPFKIYNEDAAATSENRSASQNEDIVDEVFVGPGENPDFEFKAPFPFAGGSSLLQTKVQQSKAAQFAIFDEGATCEQPPKGIVHSTKRKSLKLPTSILKARGSPTESAAEKDASVSRTEEAIINGHWNKTLCRSPDDTCDFDRAAQLASTPSGEALGQRSSSPNDTGLTKELRALIPNAPTDTRQPNSYVATEMKLSPILEISQEWASNSSASTPSLDPLSGGRITTLTVCAERKPPEDPCSQNIRKRLLDEVDLSSYQNLHRKQGPLPKGDDDLQLVNETLFFLNKMSNLENYSMYTSYAGNVVVKMDGSALPWDFYITSQLSARLPVDTPGPLCHESSCFLYQDGCVTLWRVPQQTTLRDLMDRQLDESGVAYVAVWLVEMVRQMHACRLVHGALRPDTLILHASSDDPEVEVMSYCVVAIDFSCSVDLDLQGKVTSVRSLPSAQEYIRQGVLSPSASPYQVDLLGIAETVHLLLVKRSMELVKEGSEWKLVKDSEADARGAMGTFWPEFFRKILNSGDKSTECVMSELLGDLKKAAPSEVLVRSVLY